MEMTQGLTVKLFDNFEDQNVIEKTLGSKMESWANIKYQNKVLSF